jgi:endonuclease YncB( thermonuclease family)
VYSPRSILEHAVQVGERRATQKSRLNDLCAAPGLRYPGRTVTVIQHDTDRYGRIVADIVPPDVRVMNKELVLAGHAAWYSQYDPGGRST